MGGEGAEIVSSAILLPAPEPGSGGVAQAQRLSDTKRCFYDAVAELKQTVLQGLRLLEAVEVRCQVGDT